MRKHYKTAFTLLFVLALLGEGARAQALPEELASAYRAQVDLALDVPADEVRRYGSLAEAALQSAGVALPAPQYLLIVDQDPWVQAALLLWRSAAGTYSLVGASPVSTGRSGGADDYATPVGVFDHSPANADSRSAGAADAQGIRWWGAHGMRIYDFGWQPVAPGWGDGKAARMRLLMHATDAEALERRLGSAQTEGTIWIPSSLNRLLDRYGVLDAQYEQARSPVLLPVRTPVQGAGRYLVVVRSGRLERAAWSPAPFIPHRRPAAAPPPPPPPAPAPTVNPPVLNR
jgi:hypothetical protein